MQFDWTTFGLEIVNFLVLVWLLWRFLYRPVLAAIDGRRAAIEQRLADAGARLEQAQALQRQYESRLAEWAKEREALRTRLDEELATERAARLEALRGALAAEREKHELLEERRRRDLARTAEEAARAKGAAFVAGLLTRLASPALERSIVAALVEDLARLPPERVAELQRTARESGRADVTSRYRLDESERRALADALALAADAPLECRFGEDAGLVAGLRIAVGALLLHGNLRDELESFTGLGETA